MKGLTIGERVLLGTENHEALAIVTIVGTTEETYSKKETYLGQDGGIHKSSTSDTTELYLYRVEENDGFFNETEDQPAVGTTGKMPVHQLEEEFTLATSVRPDNTIYEIRKNYYPNTLEVAEERVDDVEDHPVDEEITEEIKSETESN